jgi:hypothetical protein
VILPLVEAATELGGLGTDVLKDVAKGVKDGLSHDTFQMTLKYLFIVGFLSAIFWAVITLLVPHWHQSGEAYSDSLKKFAPHLDPKWQKEQEEEQVVPPP